MFDATVDNIITQVDFICNTNQAGDNCWGQIHKHAHPLTQRRWYMSHRRHRQTELSLWLVPSVVLESGLKSQDIQSGRMLCKHKLHRGHQVIDCKLHTRIPKWVDGLGKASVTYEVPASHHGSKIFQPLFPAAPALLCLLCKAFPPV